jgi:hypothetical protein
MVALLVVVVFAVSGKIKHYTCISFWSPSAKHLGFAGDNLGFE